MNISDIIFRPNSLQEMLRLILQRTRPFAATIESIRGSGSTIIAPGGCRDVLPLDIEPPPIDGSGVTKVSRGICGCTENVWIVTGANTEGSSSKAITYTYSVPKDKLIPGWTYMLNSVESMVGVVELLNIETDNSWPFLSVADKTYSASYHILRNVSVYEGSSLRLTISEEIAGDESSGRSDRPDDYTGVNRLHLFDIQGFITSEFSVVGGDDLRIEYTYLISCTAKGEFNYVKFYAEPNGSGKFKISNRSLEIVPRPLLQMFS